MHVLNLREGTTENFSFLVNKPEEFEDVFQSGPVTT